MTDSILIVGSGVAGLTAALQVAEAGARAIVVEQDVIIGGRLAAAMTAKSSVADSIDGVLIPKLAVLADNPSIEIVTLANLTAIDGRPGNFDVSIRERQRFVTDACTLCNHCRPVCPVVRPNEHDAGLSYRKAIYTPLAETLPQEFVIDIDSCLNTPPNYLPCNRCTEVCDDNAIFFDRPLEQTHQRQVGAIVIATGSGTDDVANLKRRGYGTHPDVVTAAEMERLLTAPGPTGGFAARPSNEDYASNILFIVDELTPYSAHTTASQVARLLAQDISDISLLITAQPGSAENVALLQALPGSLSVNHGLLQKVEASEDNRVNVTFADFSSSRIPEGQFDLVVLVSASRPAAGIDQLASVVDLQIAATGYVARPDPDNLCATSRAGVYAVGGAAGPAILKQTVAEAGLATAAALGHLDPRLLTTEDSATAAGETVPDSSKPSADALRARIETALFAMLENRE